MSRPGRTFVVRFNLYGDEAERKTPRAIRSRLIEYGGVTPHGWPMWRLVKAGDCTVLCQGTMHHFPRGIDPTDDDGALTAEGFVSENMVRPTRISGGKMLLPRYRDIDRESWILQKWFPPKMWGTAIDWKQARAEDPDTQLFLQEFPENGDYFMLAGPWRTIEEAGELTEAIQIYLRRETQKPRDAENYVRYLMSVEYANREKEVEKLAAELDRAETELSMTLKSVSRDAQLVRDRIAAEAGISGHLGASEAWG